MKILSFLTPLLFVLSLSGAAQADVPAAAQAPIAHATIEAEQCPPTAGPTCLITGDNVADAAADVDLDALPKTNPNQVLDKAAMPVPEPASAVMMALGLALLGFTARRRPPAVTFEN